MSTSQPSVRPRVSGRDIVPIAATGLIVAGAMILGGRTFAVYEVLVALGTGLGFMLALAGIQGRAETLTARGAIIGWIKLCFIAGVVLLATGRLLTPGMPVRLGIFLTASLGASLLLFILRVRARRR
jgi:hypothetical protein